MNGYLSADYYDLAAASDEMRDRLAAFQASVIAELDVARELQERGAAEADVYVGALEAILAIVHEASSGVHSPRSAGSPASWLQPNEADPPTEADPPALSLTAYAALHAMGATFPDVTAAYARAVDLGLEQQQQLGLRRAKPSAPLWRKVDRRAVDDGGAR